MVKLPLSELIVELSQFQCKLRSTVHNLVTESVISSADSPVNNHPGNVGAVKAPTRGPIR